MNINREILRLSVPAIVSNITVPLLGLSDTAIAGHLPGDFNIAAIAVGSMMLNVTFWLFGFLRMGTTGLTALAYGARDTRSMRQTFSRALTLGLAIGVALLALAPLLRAGLLGIISPDADARSLAGEYYTLCLCSAPAILGTTAIQGWLFGMQTTLMPMIVSISVNIINIALSIALVFIFHTGFIGVAYGTLAANWAGLFIALLIAQRVWKRHRESTTPLWCPWSEIFDRQALGRFFKVNTDIFFRSGCIMAVSLSVTAIGARLGELTLATNAVMMQFFHFFSFFMDGFAFTAEALTGRFAGAANLGMLRIARRALLWWSAAMALTFFLIYKSAWAPIVGFITDSPSVRANIGNYHLILQLIPPLTVAAFIYDGFFIGLTATRRMLVATAIAAAIFFAVCFVHLPGGFALPDNNTLWAAFLAYLLARGLILAMQSHSVFSPAFIAKVMPADPHHS